MNEGQVRQVRRVGAVSPVRQGGRPDPARAVRGRRSYQTYPTDQTYPTHQTYQTHPTYQTHQTCLLRA